MAPKTPTPPPLPTRTYRVTWEDGDLAGYYLIMSRPTGRELIDIAAQRITLPEQLEIVSAHVVEHNFGVSDILDLEDWIVISILRRWGEAIGEAALPPASGDS